MLELLVLASFLMGGCAMTGFNSTHGPALVTTYKDDGSLQGAKALGGITVVSHYDKRVLNILGFFGKACTIVYGI